MLKPSAQRRRRQDPFEGQQQPQVILCNHQGCTEAGIYRAPKSRKQLNEYYWFCLEHVRQYNKSWDFYAGMNQTEIESQTRQDIVGHRPTWPLGKWGAHQKRRFGAELFPEDIAEALNGDQAKKRQQQQRADRAKAANSPQEQALAVLNLASPSTWDEIKLRYKTLVKKLHPDANGGDKSAEEQLKIINQAYSTLKAAAIANA